MVLRHATAALLVLVAIPVCGVFAAWVVSLVVNLMDEAMPLPCGKRGLIVGLMGLWGVVLFGFLLGQIEWLVDRIAPACDKQKLST